MSMCISTPQARTKRWPWEKHPAFSLSISRQNGSCKMSVCISTAQARPKRVSRIGVRHFSCRFPHKMALVKCPCAFRPHRLLQNETSHTEILPKDVLEGAYTEILFRDLAKRHFAEILPIELVQRSCTQILPGGLLWRRSCAETWWRRAFLDTLNRDLSLRSLTKTFCADLL